MTSISTLCQPKFLRCMSQSYIRYRTLSFRGLNTAASVPTTPRATLTRTDEQTSLAWVQLHDQSPTSYGIFTAKGYDELIPSGAPLPHSETQTFQTIIDHMDRATFEICHRKSMLDVPVEITTVELVGIHVAKKGESKVKATMTLDQNLIGNFTVQDTFTKSKASTVFDGGVACRTQRSDKAMISKIPAVLSNHVPFPRSDHIFQMTVQECRLSNSASPFVKPHWTALCPYIPQRDCHPALHEHNVRKHCS